MRKFSVLVCLGLSLIESAEAQAPPPAARIDVIVSDARGRPIESLQLPDFEVIVNGAAQPVGEARFVKPAAALDPGEVLRPIASRSDEQAQAAHDDTRLFGLLMDEYHVSPDGAARARAVLTRFVQSQLGPRDLVILVKPLDSLVNLRMTRDRDAVLSSIAGFEGRKGVYEPRDEFERSFFAGSPERIDATRAQVTVSALNALATHLGGLAAGRKSILLVSEGMTRPERRRGEGPLPTLDTVVRSAHRSNVAIYSFDPVGGAGGDDRQALEMLAGETDGVASAAPAEFVQTLDRLLLDASAYYLLALPGLNDGRFHPVEVRVKRPGAVVRARKAVWAAPPEDRQRGMIATTPRPQLPTVARRASPLIRPWFGQSRGEGGQTRISFAWEPAARGIVQPARATAAPARIAFKAVNEHGSIIFEGVVRPAGGPGSSVVEPSRLTFEAPPGPLLIQMSIQDLQQRPIDTDVRDVAVARLTGAVVLGSSEVFRTRTARDRRALESDADAAPTAAREFSRAERLLVRVPAYADHGDRPVVEARLYSRQGGAMRELPVAPGPSDELYQIDLPLSALASGDYRLEITASAHGSIATDRVPFRVIP